MTVWADTPEGDVWDLPPIAQGPAPENHPEDWAGDRIQAGNWSGPHVARKWHDCDGPNRCIIGAGDPYWRQAILMNPTGHWRDRYVMVTKMCCSCSPNPT
jgi:hypothetical protein